MRYLKVIANEFKMDLFASFAYKFGYISDILIFGVLQTFLFMMETGSSMGELYGNDNTMNLLFIGYIIWVLSTSCISVVSGEITKEMTIGTFYHKINSGVPIVVIYVGKLLAAFVNSFISIAVLAVIALVSYGVTITLSLTALITILTSLILIYGISLMIGGLTIYFKRTGSIIFVAQIFLLLGTGVLGYSGNALPAYQKFVPLSYGIDIIRRSLSGMEVSGIMFLEHLAIAIVYLVLGIIVANMAIKFAKKNGSLLTF